MEQIITKISATLKDLRQKKGWSLDKAAEKTGVSKAMLGQIERMESSPTIATLWKIASGFDVSFSSFVEDFHHEALQKRSMEALTIDPHNRQMRIRPLFPYEAPLRFEAFIIELLPGYEHLSPPHQQGVVEHVIVTEGTLDVYAEGLWHTLTRNEGLRFDASKPHGYRNTSTEKAVFHDMIHYS